MDNRRRSLLRTALAIVAALAAAATVAATAAAATEPARAVTYHGYTVHVPASWPVFRLGQSSHTCVRFDRHAVYLGTPSTAQRCPAGQLGRTESILVSTTRAAGQSVLPSAGAGAPPAGRRAAQIVDRADHVVITATWNRDPALIERALSVRSLRSAGARFTVARAPAAVARHRGEQPASGALRAQAAHAATTPGGVYTGLGFDACQAPSESAMSAWLASPFRAAGVYIGGANMACSQPNLTAGWVAAESAAGWNLLPLYVGLQAPSNSCGCAPISAASAAAEGSAAADDAVAHAQAIGLGVGNPIYFDMEAYTHTAANTAAVLAFLGAWTARLHATGYRSGVYSSDSSGISDLVSQFGTAFPEPDDLWIANWNGQQSTTDPDVPATEWADHQRVHQYRGGHTDLYGGVRISIDSDYVDGAIAAAGAGSPPGPITVTPAPPTTPTLAIEPLPNGTLQVTPSWTDEPGIESWQLEGGSSPTALTPVGARVPVGHAGAISVRNVYAYYQVLALDANGQTLGTSATVQTPPHVALFGARAFAPRQGKGGVPVACLDATSCRVTVNIRYGRRTVSRTGPEWVAASGGIAHFKLSGRWHRFLATHRRLPVTVAVSSVNGGRASAAMHLITYTTSGRRPAQSATPSSQIKLVGGIEFVSRNGRGGVLAACVAGAPCVASPTLSVGHTVIARSNSQRLGAGLVGYLRFTLTGAGQRLLAKTTSNQLAVRVQIASQGGGPDVGASASSVSIASGRVTLAGL